MKANLQWIAVLPAAILCLILVSCDKAKRSSSSNHPAPPIETQPCSEDNPSDPSKQFQLGLRYINGRDGVEKNEVEGIKWIEKAAIQGYDAAEFELGIRYWKGTGVVQDFSKGAKWLDKASKKDNPMAQMILAEAYSSGDKVPKNDKEAIRLCKLLVSAFPSYGSILGRYYSKGDVVPLDHKIAAEWFKMAAEYGDIEGQMRLAYCYVDGQGVPQSDSDAVIWFRKAAMQGDSNAQECLGIAYSVGKGIETDMTQAARWREKAANSGKIACQRSIGGHYATGQGVPKDSVRAYMWFNIAAASGDEKSKDAREMVATHMTPEQIAEAQKMSRDWKPKKAE